MNDNAVISLVLRKLKALAVKFDCAMLVVHHTRKGRSTGDDPAEEAERIGGAAAIVNLARRAIMPVTMTDAETKAYAGSVLPSERFKYFKLADVKSNLAPLSAEAPWYELASVELPNAEPPTYPHGDRVQAVKRARLTRQKAGSPLGSEQLAIRFELMKLIDRGVMIDGETVPYSPNSTGKNNQRAILDAAMAAVERATPDREGMLIGGKHIDSADKIEILNPARPDDLVGTIVRGTTDHVDAAVRSAKSVQPTWAAMTFVQKGSRLAPGAYPSGKRRTSTRHCVRT